MISQYKRVSLLEYMVCQWYPRLDKVLLALAILYNFYFQQLRYSFFCTFSLCTYFVELDCIS